MIIKKSFIDNLINGYNIIRGENEENKKINQEKKRRKRK